MESVAQKPEVTSRKQRKTQSSPIKHGNQEDRNHFATALAHTLRKRQNIDYSTAMGPTNKKYKSTQKRKIDERKRTKI